MEYTEKLERIYAEWEQQVFQRGFEQGLKQGIEQGFRQAFVIVYEVRFGEIAEDLRAALARVEGDEELRWLIALGVTHPREDVVAAVRQAAEAG